MTEHILQRAIALKQQSEEIEKQLDFVNQQIKELEEFSENLRVLEENKEKEILANFTEVKKENNFIKIYGTWGKEKKRK